MPIQRVDATTMTDPPAARGAQRASKAPAAAQTGSSKADDSAPEATRADAQKPAAVALQDGTSLRFVVDPDTGKTVATVVDANGQVLRQVPSAEALELAKRLGMQHGLVLNLKV